MTAYSGFVAGTYRGTSRHVGIETCMNIFPEMGPQQGVKPRPMVLYGTPGCKSFSTTGGSDPVREIFHHDGRAFFVSGTGFYEVTAGAGVMLLGTVAASPQPAKMVTNGTAGNQILVINGGLGYVFNTTTNLLTQITDVDFPTNVVTAVFSDGYFLVLPFGGRVVYFSSLEDGTSWDALDKFEKSQTADAIRMMVVVSKEVWLLGSKTIEVYYNTGDALTPFAPIPGVLVEHGIAAPWSAARPGGILCWIGADEEGQGQAWFAKGYAPTRFSTHAVEQQWKKYGGLQSARAWTYAEDGHTFYVVSFVDDNATWCYDFKEDQWHERGFLENGQFQAHLASCHAFAFGKHLVGSRRDGKIYELVSDYYFDDGNYIRRVRTAPHLAPNKEKTVTVDKFALTADVGQGLTTGQGSDPLVSMEYSVDGGNTWSDELFRSLGPKGEFKQHAEWNTLGQGDDWAFRISCSEPIPIAWTGAEVNPEIEAR